MSGVLDGDAQNTGSTHMRSAYKNILVASAVVAFCAAQTPANAQIPVPESADQLLSGAYAGKSYAQNYPDKSAPSLISRQIKT